MITAIVIGSGQRGLYAYAPYAKKYPHEMKIVGVAEPDEFRRNKCAEEYNIPAENVFSDWKPLLEKGKIADVAIICTQDQMHFEPTMLAMEKGYNILLEKPISPSAWECVTLRDEANKRGLVLSICHVLRYTDFFSFIKKIVDSGEIGELVSIQHIEEVGYYHQAHSFVRGNWRNSKESSPMILAKCCHDMDILNWLVGSKCKNISSYGSLKYFKKENKPANASDRCVNGCKAKDDCPYDAEKLYIEKGSFANVISNGNPEMVPKAIAEGPYGKCVFDTDNDVVDNQVVIIEYENDVTVSFTMCAFTNSMNRNINLMGTHGQIYGDDVANKITYSNFLTGVTQTAIVQPDASGHGGGDLNIMKDFISSLNNKSAGNSRSSIDVSVESHMMAFAAEESRLTRKSINFGEFEKSLLK